MPLRKCVNFDKKVASSGFFNSIDYVLTDCDGVLWMGNDAIPGSVETIHALKKSGKKIIYVTNNATKSREKFLIKCKKLGFPDLAIDDVISTAFVAVEYLKSLNFHKKVYVLGTSGITDELTSAGIRHLPIGPDTCTEDWVDELALGELPLDPEVGAVLVGFDQDFSYPKLTKAASYLFNPEILLLATNRDEQFPSEGDIVIPGAGIFVTAVEAVAGREAVCLGKPCKHMLNCIKLVHPDIDFSRCLMIGDRLNTDILLGTQHGLKTLLVGTGINSIEDVRGYEKSEANRLLVPDYYLPRLGDLKKFING
ncbi:hypothetical protein JTE90_006714 [Oedothorax gibbosus]|uniref:Phosphoglycolate phosphatase n=1 Tax=Oedothorax gibbosus TaxID=931172 RepID=A0AAV6UII2_9ARAC|nr:hypothetical protein JTE90_006714 [Oedothorax gibbosus]